MQITFTFQGWIEHIRHLLPISGIVHVGAGVGRDSVQYASWSVPSVMFIEADETHAEKLAAALHGHPGWTSHIALMSDSEGEKDFYMATNPGESGVLRPENLSRFWRNLKTKELRAIKTTTLDVQLAASDEANPITNYVVIDCLPALPVLQGAKNNIAGWDVIIARVVLDESQLSGQGARKSELDSFLKAHGYICVALEEENQPALGRALYVRDWKTLFHSRRNEHQTQIQQLSQARDEQAKLAAERQAQIQQLTQARDEQARLAVERQTQIQQLAQARDEQAKHLGKLNQELSDARQTVSLSVKLQTLREADLKDLQARYQVSLSAQKEQHQLLAKLGERLSVLSDYFHQIANNEFTLLSDKEEKPKPVKKISQSRTKRGHTGKARKGN